MKPVLCFKDMVIPSCELGCCASVPDVYRNTVLQNNLEFCLSEEDEIFEGYGKRNNAYPYRQYLSYTRRLSEHTFKTAVLENDFLRAVFLPELGGRLWELWDKVNDRNLLYTNDVVRYSNLAVRNAWFSGGVEWNIGIIGHSPFTCEALYTAHLLDNCGCPILRMYEYERIRGVEYQMDFWLGEEDRFLNCRMRIVNSTKNVVPMYWWSNIAVPEYAGGRVVVPANSAFTSDMRKVYKVPVPVTDGIDISFYNNIPDQVDYFFDIPRESAKFIAHLDNSGYGLLHISTERLQSRKLFSWGHNEGSANWQRFLTDKGGRYLEIQAGLGKTQYGCIPMAPHTAWEWLEQYGAISVDTSAVAGSYASLEALIHKKVDSFIVNKDLDSLLKSRKTVALTKGALIQHGGGAGALAAAIRNSTGEEFLSAHLEYVFANNEQRMWAEFLQTGICPSCSPEEPPTELICERVLYDRLCDAVYYESNAANWYAHYSLALLHAYYDRLDCAVAEMNTARRLSANAWTYHGSAVFSILCSTDDNDIVSYVKSGVALRRNDIGYVKEMFRILLDLKCYAVLTELYAQLPDDTASESRICFDYMLALAHTGREQEALALLSDDFVLDDLRECETAVSDLWLILHHTHDYTQVPPQWKFESL